MIRRYSHRPGYGRIDGRLLEEVVRNVITGFVNENNIIARMTRQSEIERKAESIRSMIKILAYNNNADALKNLADQYMMVVRPDTGEKVRIERNISEYLPEKFRKLHKMGKDDAAESMYERILMAMHGKQNARLWQAEQEEKRVARGWKPNSIDGQSFKHPGNRKK